MQRDHLLVWIPPDEMARIGRQGFRRFPVAGSFIRDRRNPSLGQGRRGEVKGPAARAPGQIISLPQGGGALRGMGEKFAPDLQTGTGNFTVPIAVPVGRRGLEPKLDLAYSTGSGNGFFGLGWNVTVPGVSQKTCRGVRTYDDRQDVFLLSGSEDLVPVGTGSPTETRYRPRAEGLFARIVH